MVMKIPLLCYGQDPAAIVSFEVEQMIVPRLIGVHAAISTSLTWSSN
jgi:eukaryotic-like serine/threonine-protein kinase